MGSGGRWWGAEGGGGVLTLQFEDWFRLGADPSVHSAVSVLLDCLLRSYSFSYVEKKRSERQRNRAGPPTLTQHAIARLTITLTDGCKSENQQCAFTWTGWLLQAVTLAGW